MAKSRVFKNKGGTPDAASVRGGKPAGNPSETDEEREEREARELEALEDGAEGEPVYDEAPPGGRFIVGGREVNARGRAFSDDPDENLAPSRRELETEVEE